MIAVEGLISGPIVIRRSLSKALRSTAAETQTFLVLVPLAATETQVISLPVRLVQDVLPESAFEAQLGYCITYDDRVCPGADLQSTIPPTSLKWLPPVSFTVRYRDLGDAPDSTNHFTGTQRLAYTNVPTALANFPTVFDPSTGSAQGPVHLNPRPFHLGRRASPEAEADIGPDLDPTNNIIPPLNIANRDRRDDGIAVNLLNFSHCRAGVVPVHVLIRPSAVTYFQQSGGKSYLNLKWPPPFPSPCLSPLAMWKRFLGGPFKPPQKGSSTIVNRDRL